tara:strand:- start:989 stop:1273 length:285 start_codon:yes stop_codon:yes gene_type:complete
MVSTPGLTLSKGRVSQDGKNSTFSDPRYDFKSVKSFSASEFVAATTTNGLFPLDLEIADVTIAWAHSGTEISHLERPLDSTIDISLINNPGSVL